MMDIKTVRINDNEIDYFSFGSGKRNMVIIPGLSLKSVTLSADTIAQSYSMFCDEYTVYVFDRARHLSEGYTVENMADDTAQAMQELGVEDAYIFGASQGGMIAQIIAIKYPSLVAKLVLGSTASRLNDTARNNIEKWISLAEKRDAVALNHSIFTLLYSKEMLDSLGDTLYELEKDGTDEDMARFVIMAGACMDFDVYDSLSKIKCDTLVIGALNDQVLTGDASVEIAQKMNCELFMYDGGHAIYDEAVDYKSRIYNFFIN